MNNKIEIIAKIIAKTNISKVIDNIILFLNFTEPKKNQVTGNSQKDGILKKVTNLFFFE
jgi:hypothetical protein